MRLGLAEINGTPTLVALKAGGGVRPGNDLPADPLAILNDPALRKRAEAAIAAAPALSGKVRLLPPLAQFKKIICVGLNYADHAAESPYEKPKFPVFFLRLESGIIGPNDSIIRPQVSEHLDFEGEMVVVLGKGGRRISEANA